MMDAAGALRRLRLGNARFVAQGWSGVLDTSAARRGSLVERQSPFAIILGCSDSRVPAEIVFDEGLGELFVIRVAGNIVAPSQVGSVEFAAEQFGTRLVVVMGHTHCGAVQATLEQLSLKQDVRSPNIHAIVDRIRPAVEGLVAAGLESEALMRRAVRANIQASAELLRHGSAVLERLIREQGLVVVGAEYALDTGVVDFFDGVPPGS